MCRVLQFQSLLSTEPSLLPHFCCGVCFQFFFLCGRISHILGWSQIHYVAEDDFENTGMALTS